MTTHVLVPRRIRATLPTLGLGDLDRVFDRLWHDVAAQTADTTVRQPRIDFTETDSELRVAAELPGIEEKDIDVSLDDGVLTIRAERVAEEREEDARGVRLVETFRGKLERSLRLPAEVDAERVRAVHKNGILTVTLPKLPEVQPRNIPITGAA